MTHRTSKTKREDRAKYFREKARVVFELEPTANVLWMAGVIVDNLKRHKVPEKQITNIELKMIHELTAWDNFEKFIQIAVAFSNIVQNATGAQVFVEVI